ncbi:MAG: 30S ribosomal protein S5 [Candidatus Omnitrophota bacterium]
MSTEAKDKVRVGAVKEETAGQFIERVVKISRVSKVVKGGKNFSFNALVVVGNTNGSAGIGFGKSNEVVEAIKKGVLQAKKSFVSVNVLNASIPHEVVGRFKASRVLLKPASVGTGVIAGGPVRALCDAIGIKNILTKSLGSRNAINVVKAAMNGFEQLRLNRQKD